MMGLGKSILDITAGFESVQAGLKTATGSAETASAVFEQLRKLSYETTFGMEELAQSATFLLNAGQSSNSINDTLIMLGNIATGDKSKFIELSDIYTKILNLGKAGSEQLEMLATRGIPIKQTLKEMGVAGTASAEDITNAFRKMTEEGGKFAGAMDNMNDTIEGKRGFITDTLKEIAVNFGEASGITQSYKEVLDFLKDALDKVNNVLMSVNSNPVAKALTSGLVAASLTALVAIIGTALVGALAAVRNRLVQIAALKMILDPKTLGIAALVGGIAGVGLAFKNMADSANKAAEAAKNAITPPSAESRNDFLKSFYDTSIGDYKSRIEDADRQIADIRKQLSLPQYQIQSKEEYASAHFSKRFAQTSPELVDKAYSNYRAPIDRNKSSLESQLSALEKQRQSYEESVSLYEGLKTGLEDVIRSTEEYSQLQDKINSITGSYQTSAEKNLAASQKQYKELEDFIAKGNKGYAVQDEFGNKMVKTFTDEQRKALEEAGARIKRQIESAKVKIAIESGADWQKDLQKALGLSDREAVSGGAMGSSRQMLSAYNDKWSGYLANDLGDSGNKQLEYLSSSVNALEALQKANLNLDNNDKFSLNDNAVKGLIDLISKSFTSTISNLQGIDVQNPTNAQEDSIDVLVSTYRSLNTLFGETNPVVQDFKNKLEAAGIAVEDSGNKIQNNDLMQKINDFLNEVIVTAGDNIKNGTASMGDYFSYAGATMGQSLISYSGDLQNFMQGFTSTGNIFGGIISAVVGALINVCQGLDGFEEAMNPVTTLVSSLSELIRFLMSIISAVLKMIKGVATGINTVIKILKPLLTIITTIITALGNFTEFCGNLVEKFFSWLLPWVDATKEETALKEEEAERLKRLNDQYTALYTAMKEQEEWYLNKQYEMRGQASIEKATGVNDMILTPSGVFSTHPEDTIMAMKHPENLLGGGSSVIVNVNNSSSAQVQARSSTDGSGNTVLDIDVISQRVADDYAEGNNGWDNAVSSQQNRLAGRAIAL